MDQANLQLSAKEAQLVANADWILTKNEILQKVQWLLASLQEKQQETIRSYSVLLPGEVTSIHAKISRGENYRGLPWLILDYPRFFGKEDQFAIRTMFWWGNFFSITLQVSGLYKKKFENKIQAGYIPLRDGSFYICVNDDQWQHHFEADNYSPLTEISEAEFANHLRKKDFIKLAKKIPLDQWNKVIDKMSSDFSELIGLLISQPVK